MSKIEQSRFFYQWSRDPGKIIITINKICLVDIDQDPEEDQDPVDAPGPDEDPTVTRLSEAWPVVAIVSPSAQEVPAVSGERASALTVDTPEEGFPELVVNTKYVLGVGCYVCSICNSCIYDSLYLLLSKKIVDINKDNAT